jgi:hypothetical protein
MFIGGKRVDALSGVIFQHINTTHHGLDRGVISIGEKMRRGR